MKKLLLMAVATIALCSCGGLTNISTPNSVALNEGNFKFVKVVRAETQASYVLGIGGLSDRATDDVVELLRQEASLEQNQALADIHIKSTTKVWFLGLYITRTLTATATVVEFSNNESTIFFSGRSVPESNERNEQNSISTVEVQVDVTNTITPPTDYNKETAIARLTEINQSLQNGTVDDIKSIISEIESIKKWYEGHNMIYIGVERELRLANKILKNMK